MRDSFEQLASTEGFEEQRDRVNPGGHRHGGAVGMAGYQNHGHQPVACGEFLAEFHPVHLRQVKIDDETSVGSGQLAVQQRAWTIERPNREACSHY